MVTMTYGLMISRRTLNFSTDKSEYVDVTVVCRENYSDKPQGCRSDGESEIWDSPKAVCGLMLDGLGMRGSIYSYAKTLDDAVRTFSAAIEYKEVYYIDSGKCQKMTKTFKLIEKQFEKDGSPRDPGDIFISFAKALKLSFVVINCHPEIQRSWNNTEWRWLSIPEGRDTYRSMIREAAKTHLANNGISIETAA